MPFEPLALPYWTVASWNPDVNEARANGEYPTAGWANQLQGLHDTTIGRVNEIGDAVDALTVASGAYADPSALPGTILVRGATAYEGMPPGTSAQVPRWNANVALGMEPTFLLPSAWVAVTLDASATNGTPPLQVRFDGHDTAEVRGVVTKTSSGVMATLAPAYRPKYARTFALTPTSPNQTTQHTAVVGTDGTISVPNSAVSPWHVYCRFEIATPRTF